MKLKYSRPKVSVSTISESYFFNSREILNSLDNLIFIPVFASDGGGDSGDSESGGSDSGGSDSGGGCGGCGGCGDNEC